MNILIIKPNNNCKNNFKKRKEKKISINSNLINLVYLIHDVFEKLNMNDFIWIHLFLCTWILLNLYVYDYVVFNDRHVCVIIIIPLLIFPMVLTSYRSKKIKILLYKYDSADFLKLCALKKAFSVINLNLS